MGRPGALVSFLGACRAINSAARDHPEVARAARSELWHLPQDEAAFREHVGTLRVETEEQTLDLIDQVLQLVGNPELSVMQEWQLGQLVYDYLRGLGVGYPRNPQWDDQKLLNHSSG